MIHIIIIRFVLKRTRLDVLIQRRRRGAKTPFPAFLRLKLGPGARRVDRFLSLYHSPMMLGTGTSYPRAMSISGSVQCHTHTRHVGISQHKKTATTTRLRDLCIN